MECTQLMGLLSGKRVCRGFNRGRWSQRRYGISRWRSFFPMDEAAFLNRRLKWRPIGVVGPQLNEVGC